MILYHKSFGIVKIPILFTEIPHVTQTVSLRWYYMGNFYKYSSFLGLNPGNVITLTKTSIPRCPVPGGIYTTEPGLNETFSEIDKSSTLGNAYR